MKTFGRASGGRTCIAVTRCFVPSTRLERIRAFCAAVHRFPKIGSPRRLTTTSAPPSSVFGSTFGGTVSTSCPSTNAALAASRVITRTESFRALSFDTSALPMNPVPPETRIFMEECYHSRIRSLSEEHDHAIRPDDGETDARGADPAWRAGAHDGGGRRSRDGEEVRHRDDLRELGVRLRGGRRPARARARAQAHRQARRDRDGLRRPGPRRDRSRALLFRGQPAELAGDRALQGREARAPRPALGDRRPGPAPDREGSHGGLRPALRAP